MAQPYWSSTHYDTNRVWIFSYYGAETKSYLWASHKQFNWLVRCVKDSTVVGKPNLFIWEHSISNQTTAYFDLKVHGTGGSPIIQKGVCISTSQNPDTSNIISIETNSDTIFTSSISGLSPNTVYYVRPYAMNNIFIGYGKEIQIYTGSPPNIRGAKGANYIADTTAVYGGYIESDNGLEIQERGVCYSTTNQQPTINDSRFIEEKKITGVYSI